LGGLKEVWSLLGGLKEVETKFTLIGSVHTIPFVMLVVVCVLVDLI